jgi:WhiB family redox-sensing transcriptional regulator
VVAVVTDHAGRPWAQAALPGPWADRAACIGEADLFFPPNGSPGERTDARDYRIKRALAICDRCPVRVECLDFAVTNKEHHGIWGGRVLDKSRRARDAGLHLLREDPWS